MPAYRGSLKVSRGAGLAMGMLAAAAGKRGNRRRPPGGELSASVCDVLSMATVSSGKLSVPVSGVLLTAAVSDALSSWCMSVLAVSLRWSLVSGQRAQLRLTPVLHGGGEHWHRRVDHSPPQEDLRRDAEEELQSR